MLGEGGQEGVVVNDFSGGETDFPLAGNPKQSAKLTNFLIREDNKAFIRNGSEIADYSTKASNSSNFITNVKGKGQTTFLDITQNKSFVVETKEYLYTSSIDTPWDSAATWSLIKLGTNTKTFQAVTLSTGATTTFTSACESVSDKFGIETYIHPREIDALYNITTFAHGVTIIDDAGALSVKSFGLPKPNAGLYALTFAQIISFYNDVATKFKNHALNVYDVSDHAAKQDSGDYDCDLINTAVSTSASYDTLNTAVKYLWGCMFYHIKDARVKTLSSIYHNQSGNYDTGMLSFYPKPLSSIIAAEEIYNSIYDMAVILNLHAKDFLTFITWASPAPGDPAIGDFRHVDHTSPQVNLAAYKLYNAYVNYTFQDLLINTVSSNGLYPMGESLYILNSAGCFSSITTGTAYIQALSDISTEFASGYSYTDLVFFIVSLGYATWDSTSHASLPPKFGCGDISSSLPEWLNAPENVSTADITDLISQEALILSTYWGSTTHFDTFTVSPMDVRILLENTFTTSDGTQKTEVSGVQELELPCFIETYKRKGSSVHLDQKVTAIKYEWLPRPVSSWNIPSTSSLKVYRLSSDTTDNEHHLTSSIAGDTPYTTAIPGDYFTKNSLKSQPTDYLTETDVNGGCIFSCLSFTVVNNCGWAVAPVSYETNVETLSQGFMQYPYRLVQSLQNALTNFPPTFYYDFKEKLICCGHAINKPIVVSEKSVYRIDGVYASDGSGAIIPEKISSLSGGVSPLGIISVNNKVFFAGEDGFYMTDGYQCIPISGNLKARYATIEKSKTKAVFSKEENSIYWLISYATTGYSEIWVLNLEKQISDSSCFTVLTGKDSNMLAPCATFSDEGELIRGDKDGFIFIHRNSLLADPRINRTTHELSRAASGAILSDYIPFDYRSLHHSFGTTNERKYVTQYSFAIENLSPETSESFTTQPYYSNDKDRLTVGSSGYVPLSPIRIETSTAGIFSGKRLFSAGGLRCLYKQIGFTNGSVKICDSASVGASGSSVGTAFVLDGPKTFPYSDLVGCYLYTELDNYSTGYEIVANSANTLVFASALPSIVSLAWKITGVPKTERFAIVEVSIPMVKFGTVEQNQKDSPT